MIIRRNLYSRRDLPELHIGVFGTTPISPGSRLLFSLLAVCAGVYRIPGCSDLRNCLTLDAIRCSLRYV